MGSAPADPGYLFLFNKIQEWTLIVVKVVIRVATLHIMVPTSI